MLTRITRRRLVGIVGLFGKQALGSYPYEDVCMRESARQLIKADLTTINRCNHNNECMATAFGNADCVVVPDDHYGPVGAPGETKYAVTRPRTAPVVAA